jgi:hypothetical protein
MILFIFFFLVRLATIMSNVEGRNIKIETISAPNVLAPAIFYAEQNKMPVEVVANSEVCFFAYIKIGFHFYA